jgi:hypothetical protein
MLYLDSKLSDEDIVDLIRIFNSKKIDNWLKTIYIKRWRLLLFTYCDFTKIKNILESLCSISDSEDYIYNLLNTNKKSMIDMKEMQHGITASIKSKNFEYVKIIVSSEKFKYVQITSIHDPLLIPEISSYMNGIYHDLISISSSEIESILELLIKNTIDNPYACYKILSNLLIWNMYEVFKMLFKTKSELLLNNCFVDFEMLKDQHRPISKGKRKYESDNNNKNPNNNNNKNNEYSYLHHLLLFISEKNEDIIKWIFDEAIMLGLKKSNILPYVRFPLLTLVN